MLLATLLPVLLSFSSSPSGRFPCLFLLFLLFPLLGLFFVNLGYSSFRLFLVRLLINFASLLQFRHLFAMFHLV